MARLTAVLLTAVLIVPLMAVGAANAAPVTLYRTSAAGPSGYRALAASAGGGADLRTTVHHGSSRGSFRFRPGASTSADRRPGTTASGVGWATTGSYSGVVPAGTWSFAATVRTDTPADLADGHVAVAVYAVGGGSSRLLGFVQGTTNVLAGPGDRSITLSDTFGEVTLRDERIATEWYLVIRANEADAGGSSTSLRQGTAGDSVTIPGEPPPTALRPPGTLRVDDNPDNRVTLSWDPSPDPAVTGYVVRRASAAGGPWTVVATVAGTSYTDTGLPNGVRVYHTVLARDASGRVSAPSNATSAVPSDTTTPASPSPPTVSPAGSGRLHLTWTASSSSDVVGYEVQRSAEAGGPFSRIAGPVGGTSYTNEGLPARSTWHYRLVAIDDDGLRSAPTSSAAGTVAPAPPSGLQVAAEADRAVALEWQGVPGAVEYLLERDGGSGFVAVGRPTGTSFTDSGLTNGVTYRYRVRAVDAAGAASSPSGTVSATPEDTGVPAPPGALAATERGASGVRLSWSPSASASTVGYRVSRAVEDGSFTEISGLITATSFADGPLPVGVPHRYRVVAEDAAGARSFPAGTSFTVAPAAPRNLRSGATNETTVQLSWDPTNDPRAGYRVLRADRGEGNFVGVSGLLFTTSFSDGGLVLGRQYEYVVVAEAVDGTRSDPSNTILVEPRNGPPTPPTGLVAADTGAGGQISLTWPPNPESDVVRYRIERSTGGGAWSAIRITSATTELDNALQDGVTYRYRVIAIDAVGQSSAPSEVASATPSDTEPPPAPGQPLVSQSGPSLVVQWSATPGAQAYIVSRALSPDGPFGELGTATDSRVFTDATVERGVTYYYVVQARDRAGNVSPMSAVASGRVSAVQQVPTLPGGPGTDPTAPGGGGATDGGTGGTLFPGLIDPAPLTPTSPGSGGPQDGTSTDQPPQAIGGSNGDADPPPNTIDPPLAAGTPERGLNPQQERAADLFALGDLPGAFGATAQDVADNVGEVAQTFRIPLVLLLVLAAYLVVQGRIDRATVTAVPEAATGGEDDDVEYIL